MLLFMARIDNEEDLEFMMNLHDRYHRLVYNKAVQFLADDREIEDLTQDCWEKLVKHIETLKTLEEKALAAYIAKTVRNTAYNYTSYQSVRSRHSVSADVDDIYREDTAPSPEERVLLSEQLENFHKAFSLLSESDQLLLEGKYILRWSDAELAEVFHCKPASIRMKLSRARGRAEVLLQEGEDSNGQT